MNDALVSIVILNWNGKEHLVDCLESVLQTTYAPLEIIVVDNGSTDGSVSLVRSKYASVQILENGQNLGYAEGNNRGFQKARGEFVVTLNNDVVVEPTWLNKPIHYLENDARIGIVSCRQMNYYDHSLIDSLFHYPAPDLSFARVGHGEPFDPASWHNVPGYVIAPNGGSAIYRKEMFQQVGGFDIFFFAYHDETDLGMRAFLSGWKCLFVPEAVVYHKDGASFKKTSGKAHYFHVRNKLWFMYKYFPASFIVKHLDGIAIEELRLFKRLIFKEKVPLVYLMAKVDGITGIFKYANTRKKYTGIFCQYRDDFNRLEKEKIIIFDSKVTQ